MSAEVVKPHAYDHIDRQTGLLRRLLEPGGIEQYVHRGCAPLINSGSGGNCYVHLPPQEATDKSWMVREVDGHVCYLDKNDAQGEGCDTLMVDEETGRVLRERILAKEFGLLSELPVWKQAYLRLRYALRTVGKS